MFNPLSSIMCTDHPPYNVLYFTKLRDKHSSIYTNYQQMYNILLELNIVILCMDRDELTWLWVGPSRTNTFKKSSECVGPGWVHRAPALCWSPLVCWREASTVFGILALELLTRWLAKSITGPEMELEGSEHLT